MNKSKKSFFLLFTPLFNRASLCFAFYLLLFTLSNQLVIAQIGGNNTYEFLNLVTSARVAALGGNVISVKDDDLNLAWNNPSLLDSTMNNHLVLNYVDYFADINYGSIIFSKTYKKYGSFSLGTQYINYGTFTEADPTGLIIREFTAKDYAFIIGWGRGISLKINENRRIDSVFSIGANLKILYSKLEQYTSYGTALDLSGTYHNSGKRLTAVILVKNIGLQLKTYVTGNREPLPFEIQAGISKKLKHAPFRFSLIAQHLEKWDLTYEDQNDTDTGAGFPGNEEDESNERFGDKIKSFGDKLMRHIVIGGEVMITDNFHLRLGYNYQRRKELQVATNHAMTGFSFGFGFKISKFHISYGRSSYHLAGGPNYFTVTTNLSEFYSKAK